MGWAWWMLGALAAMFLLILVMGLLHAEIPLDPDEEARLLAIQMEAERRKKEARKRRREKCRQPTTLG